MDDEVDFYRGNPEDIVVGKVEKPARKHAPQKPKPVLSGEHKIKAMIGDRMLALAPYAEEYAKLAAAYDILKDVK